VFILWFFSGCWIGCACGFFLAHLLSSRSRRESTAAPDGRVIHAMGDSLLTR
jgi:hypothetical protein